MRDSSGTSAVASAMVTNRASNSQLTSMQQCFPSGQ